MITETNSIVCNGDADGELTGTVTGGTSTYSYDWGTSAGGTDVADPAATASLTNVQGSLGPDTYYLTVTDDNSCTASDNITITQPDALTATSSGGAALDCNGDTDGTFEITGSGGTGALTYSNDAGATWESNTAGQYQNSGVFNTLAAGSLTVTLDSVVVQELASVIEQV